MKKIPINILLTSAGGVGTPIALKGLRISKKYKARIILADSNPAAPNLHLKEADVCYCIPKCNSPHFIDSLARLIKKEKIDFLHSGLDEEMPIIAKNEKLINSLGCKFLLPKKKPLENAFNKKNMYLILKNKVRMPKTYFLDKKLGYKKIYDFLEGKVFLKHGISRGGRGLYFPRDFEEYLFMIKQLKKYKLANIYMIQEFIEGEEYNVLSLHDKEGKVIFAVSRKKLTREKIKSNTNIAVIEKKQDLIDLALKALKEMNLARGFNNVDMRVAKKSNKPYLTEINGGRISAQDMNVFAAGINLIELYIDIIRGKEVKPIPLKKIKDGITMLRTNNDIIIDYKDIEKIKFI